MSTTLTQRLRPEWIDYNGHLSEAYYVLIFGFATDALMDRVGLDAAYRERTGCSLYTVEAHVRYLREVAADAEVEVRTRVIGPDTERPGAKKARLCHEMWVDGTVVATEELMALHVDQGQGRTVPFPEEVAARLTALGEPAPEYAGRSIGG
ncbi:thioesterase family protein [Nocardiopsis sp. MG754419]|uniref:thioesterase family protein n=1 Tax=Nocardiopsis sp. MG754419 TaxID=2259865 RepID=UPI001BA9289D|nr:thioesterase family protein [Nocardiopsis sp. MG754419]MBR8741785.1 thioesterase [Nocardiopsis sp. MG754419]